MALQLTGALNCILDYTSVSILRVHLACGFQTKGPAKLRPQNLKHKWVFSRLTSNSPQQLLDEIYVS